MKRLGLLLLVALLLTGVAAVGAQESSLDDAGKAAVAEVAAAFEAMSELDSFTITQDQTIAISITMGAGGQSTAMEQNILQTTVIKVQRIDDESYNLAATYEQGLIMAAGMPPVTTRLELIYVDGVLYGRVDEAPAMLSSMAPEGWVNLTELETPSPLFAGFTPEVLAMMFSFDTYPVDELAISAIESAEPLDPEEVDGAATRGYTAQYDIASVLDSGAFDGFGAAFGSQMPGVDPAEVVQQMFAEASLQLSAWIGEDDGLLRRVTTVTSFDATMTMAGQELPMGGTVESVSTFSGFNEPFEIIAPELGS